MHLQSIWRYSANDAEVQFTIQQSELCTTAVAYLILCTVASLTTQRELRLVGRAARKTEQSESSQNDPSRQRRRVCFSWIILWCSFDPQPVSQQWCSQSVYSPSSYCIVLQLERAEVLYISVVDCVLSLLMVEGFCISFSVKIFFHFKNNQLFHVQFSYLIIKNILDIIHLDTTKKLLYYLRALLLFSSYSNTIVIVSFVVIKSFLLFHLDLVKS